MAVNCCRQRCAIKVCKYLWCPLIQSTRTIHVYPAIQVHLLAKIHLSKHSSHPTSIFKSFHSSSLFLQKFPVLCPSYQISANVLSQAVLFSFWAWSSIFLLVTPFIWNSFPEPLKFRWFTWPLTIFSLLSAPTCTVNLHVHLSKLHWQARLQDAEQTLSPYVFIK